ncbi:MAG: ABC transporter permease, partial [Actinomyces oris]
LWQIFNQIWMYASGVVFPLNMLDSVQNRLFDAGWQINGAPIPITTIARLNPAETYLEAFRSCLYDFALPSLPVSLACLGWAVVMLTLGLAFFRRHSASIVEEL